jgi:DNA-binding NarL/FixJ family response regulator
MLLPIPTDSPSSEAQLDRSSRIAVSLVEDNKKYRQLITDLVSGEPGLELFGVYPDVPTAVADLPARPAKVLLLDIHLPGISGVEGIRTILEASPTTLIVMLTAFNDNANVFAAFRAGAVGYLLKSANRSQILDAINDAVDGGSPMSSSIARIVVRSMHTTDTKFQKELSAREHELLNLFASGLRYKEVAAKMGVSINTIRSYSRRVYEKLQANSRMEAVYNYNLQKNA